MQEEKELNVSGEKVEDMTPDYLAAINELKQNSVNREDYNKLKAENKKLLDSIVNNVPVEVQSPQRKSIEELRAAYLKEDQTNLEYISNALKLREALISEGKPDPFLPIGEQILPTDEDIAAANKVASVLQECVDYADGNPEVFNDEFKRRIN